MATTKHAGTMTFGRCAEHKAGHIVCPRCTELDCGARPVQWARTRQTSAPRVSWAAHAASAAHAACGPVCTFGEW